MATKKKIVKTSTKETTDKVETTVIKTEMTPLSSLKTFAKNPRVGDIDGIAESIQMNGQYKPITVNLRTMQVLAGNHTFMAMKKLNRTEMLVSFVDVDEEQATRIVLADNKTSDLSYYDDDVLIDLIKSLPDLQGTGYDQTELDELLSGVGDFADIARGIDSEINNQRDIERELAKSKTFEGSSLGDEPDPRMSEPIAPPLSKNDDLENAPEKLGGLVQFSPPEDVVFDGVGDWGIPRLREDMFMTWEDVPDNLDSWAGSATKDWEDEEQWWLYNWGIDSTSGMKDISKVVVSFYAFDDYFDNWWYFPERYIVKLLNSKIKYMLTPNWSQASQLPRVESLWNLYRARWVGRYCQEAGIKVCPDIAWRDGDIEHLRDNVLATLPKNIPLIAIQIQNTDWEKATGGEEHFLKQINLIFDTLKPQGVIFYAGAKGRAWIDEIAPDWLRYRFIGTRMEKLSETAKGRQKKTTI